ncbi:TOMM precursor leader peptide-binding protein [Streptomyces sp. NBC_01613]|uniref:TOMM precursor leader peptide-binding protein n=1 Tax=Streptomyces sp. NBC_01613 TaxID=2975896 RepID=UPI0038689DBB
MGAAESAAPLLGFKPHLRVEQVPGEAVYLISDQRVTALHGEQIARLAPLLDGTRPLDRIARDAADTLPAVQTAHLVDRLDGAGLLAARDHAAAPEEEAEQAYWEAAGLNGSAAAEGRGTGTVRALSVGNTDARELAAALRAAGLTVLDPDAETRGVGADGPQGCCAGERGGRTDGARAGGSQTRAAGADGAEARGAQTPAARPGGVQACGAETCAASTADPQAPGGALTIVACDDYLDPALAVVDAEHRAAGRRWLPVRTEGTEQWVGPFLGDPDGPCWACLAERLWRTRPVEAHVQRMLGRSGPVPRPSCALPAARLAALQTAALEATKWLSGFRHPSQLALRTLDGLALTAGLHPVRRRPQCPTCGEPGMTAAQVQAPVELRSRMKHDTEGGGHRSLTPRQLLERFGHHIDPVTGLVREIRRDARGPEFFHSYCAGTNPAAGHGLGALRAGLRSSCGGKGTTALQAEVGAFAEALERHCGHYEGGESVVTGSYRELAPAAVHPDAVQLYDPRQFTGRAAWNAGHSSFQYVGDPFDEDAETGWTPLWSLTENRQKLLPTSLLYYGVPQPPGHVCCLANSNGTAAGGTLEDAVLQGFLELVERDALALWWYNRTHHPAVDLDAFDDPWTTELRRVHASLDREVWVLDLTADLGIPVLAAVSRRTDRAPGESEEIMFGFGAHFDVRVALRRALTELNQMMPHVVEGVADRGSAADDPDVGHWLRTATTAAHPYLLPDGSTPTGPHTHPYTPRDDLRDDIEAAVDLLRAHGMELLVLDQSRPDVGLPVVRVVVPGLRPHWARFAPGRLFDVPVKLGRLARPTPYDDLNPVPLFL